MALPKLIAALIMAVGVAGAAQAAMVEGKDFKTLPQAVPQAQADKIEVTEFFGYFCIHCYHLEPTMEAHARQFPTDTYLRPIHVVWNDAHLGLARVAAAVEASGTRYQANPAIFKAVMDERIDLSNPDTFKAWAAKQTAFDSKKVLAAYNGFQNPIEAKTMADMTAKYQIQGTPTIIVGGKYQLLSQDMGKLDELIQKVRNERGMPAAEAKPIAKVKATGARLAAEANR